MKEIINLGHIKLNLNLQEKFWLKEDDEIILKRRLERKNIMLECKTYIENEGISENKEILVYGFKYIKTY